MGDNRKQFGELVSKTSVVEIFTKKSSLNVNDIPHLKYNYTCGKKQFSYIHMHDYR
jgi:hypothetical protein